MPNGCGEEEEQEEELASRQSLVPIRAVMSHVQEA